MLVGVDCERRVAVPEPLGHDLDGNTGFDEKGAVGVRTSWRRILATPVRATILSNACEMEWQRKTPRRLVSTTRSHSASVISAAGVPGCSTPALLKAISSRPNVSAALRRADWTWSMT